MRITLKWKVIVAGILIEVLVLALLAGINVEINNDYLDQIVKQRIEQLNTCLSNQFEHHLSDLNADSITSSLQVCQIEHVFAYFILFDQNGRVVNKIDWPGAHLSDHATLSEVTKAIGAIPWKTPSFYKSISLSTPGYSSLLFGGTSLYKKQAQNELAKKLLLISSIILVVSLILILFVMVWVRQHLKALENAANEILQGNYDVSIDSIEKDKTGYIGFVVNLVTISLKNQIQALRISEGNERQTAERMLKVIDAVPDFMLINRVSDACIIYTNSGVENMTGYAYNELVGTTMDDVDFGITKAQRREWQDDLARNGVLINFETIIKHKNGNLVNVLVSASLLEIDNAAHVLIICRDITDRKLVEAAVAYANRELNYVLDAASEIAIISMDVKGIVQMFNRGAEKMLGHRARDMIGKPMRAEIHDKNELAQRSKELSSQFNQDVPTSEVLTINPVKQGSETRNWTYICKNGQLLNVSLTVTRVQDGAGKIIGFLGIARDITLQLQAERALKELNYKLEKRVEERTSELEETNQNLANTMHNLQLAQAELVRSEKLTALGDIVAVVAHEINTPIGNCLTVATTLRDRSAEMFDEVEKGNLRRSSLSSFMNDSRAGMEILIRGLHRSSELVSNFKQVAADQTSEQRRTFKLHVVINEVVALMMPKLRKTPHNLDITIPEEISMDSFPGPIEQIVTNLINNAILHAFDEDKPGSMKLTAIKLNQHVKIEFSDDGRGIPENYLNRIFDPFFTTKLGRGGTGLGLNIVHNIVKKMLGGQIEVSSHAGKGTSFVIILPLCVPAAAQVEKRQSTHVV